MTDTKRGEPDRKALGKRKDRIGPRLKAALNLMIWQGMQDGEAAARAGITVYLLRDNLKRAVVRRYLSEQREVLIARESGRNIAALVSVRDESTNGMARIAAVRAIESLEVETSAPPGRAERPGLIIVIRSEPNGGTTIGVSNAGDSGAQAPLIGDVNEDGLRVRQEPQQRQQLGGPAASSHLRRTTAAPTIEGEIVPDHHRIEVAPPAVRAMPQRPPLPDEFTRGTGGGLPPRKRRE